MTVWISFRVYYLTSHLMFIINWHFQSLLRCETKQTTSYDMVTWHQRMAWHL